MRASHHPIEGVPDIDIFLELFWGSWWVFKLVFRIQDSLKSMCVHLLFHLLIPFVSLLSTFALAHSLSAIQAGERFSNSSLQKTIKNSTSVYLLDEWSILHLELFHSSRKSDSIHFHFEFRPFDCKGNSPTSARNFEQLFYRAIYIKVSRWESHY